MKSFKERCKKIASGKWFFPVVMNVIVMFLLMLLFYAKYNSEMDVFMQTLLYGTSGTGTPMSHLVFINVIAGGVLDLLIKIAPGVAWYTVMHYAGTLAALISISYVFVNRYGKTRVCKILATVISIFVGYECYITPMYMKTTILLAVYLCLMGLVLYYIFSGTFVGSIQETEDIGDIVTKRQEESEYAHLVDLTGYFQKFSIYTPYVEKMDSENSFVLNGYYQWVPGYRNYREMYLNGYVGYNLYVRNDVARRCVVNSIKLDIALSGYEREYTTDFNGMRQYSIVQKTYAEAEDDSL